MVTGGDINDELDDIENLDEIKELQALEEELNDALYKVGYDSGYFEGLKTSQENIAPQVEDMIYDAALTEVIEFIRAAEFTDKESLISSLEMLRHTGD